MEEEIGQQYPADKKTDRTGFLEKARRHQSEYRAFKLKLPFDGYGNYLCQEDAAKGKNFYNDFDIFDHVKKRYPKYCKSLYANMLRSEHIGFNLFVPFKSNMSYALKVFNVLLHGQIKSIDHIEIEYAPSPAKNYLNDKTSFDTYVEYTHTDNQKGIIGIEVKYTEQAYPLKKGSKQDKDIHETTSKYRDISNQCGLYKLNTIEQLISDKFRQIWRNQLLGESILIHDNTEFKHFTSITIFPQGNQHFIETSKAYIEMLTNNYDNFVSVTYEDFLEICKRHLPSSRFGEWVGYLRERYVF